MLVGHEGRKGGREAGREGGNVPVDISRVLGHLERDLDVGHGPQVVDLVGADLGDELRRGGREGGRAGMRVCSVLYKRRRKDGGRKRDKRTPAVYRTGKEGRKGGKEGGRKGRTEGETYLGQVGGVGQVAVVEEEVHARGMSVFVQVLDAVGVEGGRATDDLARKR